MASSPADREATTFALREAIACWDQGYEALAQGDLERVEALLRIVDEHLQAMPAATGDDPDLAKLHAEASAARGRLEHGMKAGLDGLQRELARVRKGTKVLQGYRDTTRGLGDRFEKSI